MYGIAQKAKAAVLLNEITGNELLYNAGFPDSIMSNRHRLCRKYCRLLLTWYFRNPGSQTPTAIRLSLWKDAIFTMNREMEKLTLEIDSEFPQYRELLQKTEPVALAEIQNHLGRDETIVDYLLSNQYNEGKRELYTFLITKKTLNSGKPDSIPFFQRMPQLSGMPVSIRGIIISQNLPVLWQLCTGTL